MLFPISTKGNGEKRRNWGVKTNWVVDGLKSCDFFDRFVSLIHRSA